MLENVRGNLSESRDICGELFNMVCDFTDQSKKNVYFSGC